MMQRAQAHVLDNRTEVAQYRDRRLDRLAKRGVRRRVFLPEMPHHTDAQPLDASAQPGGEIRHGARGTTRIVRIMAGDRLQNDGAILDRARYRAGVITAHREW